MLANANKSLLLGLLVILCVIALAVLVGGVFWSVVKVKKAKSSNYKKVVIWTYLSIIIATASWVFNFGWLRFIMTIMLIPVIHGIVFFVANLIFGAYVDQSPKMKRLNIFFVITYIVYYVLIPDGGDYGVMYSFFGLIHSNTVSGVSYSISTIASLCHGVLFVMQIVQVRKIKKQMRYTDNLIRDALNLFPKTIDISDGELRSDEAFFSNNLSETWHKAVESTGTTGENIDFMIWSVFGLLHKIARDNFERGIYQVAIEDIDIDSLKNEYLKSIEEAK